MSENGDLEYAVSLILYEKNDAQDLVYDDTLPLKEQSIYVKVPRRAIRWAEKPYMDDEHLPNAFRHPIEFPAELVPKQWKSDS
jgi:hypothetical protein